MDHRSGQHKRKEWRGSSIYTLLRARSRSYARDRAPMSFLAAEPRNLDTDEGASDGILTCILLTRHAARA